MISVLRMLLCVFIAMPVFAQEYPYRPVRIIAPNPPGGGFDLIARVVSQKLSEQFNQQVVVENRTGAGTLVGTEAAAKSTPDGYTLLVGGLSNIAANVGLYKKLPYDPLNDFVPVGMVASYSYSLVSRKDLPQQTLRELIDFARAPIPASSPMPPAVSAPASTLRLRRWRISPA